MIPWTELGRTDVPGSDTPMILARRGDEFIIRVGPTPLMSSRMHDSEDALAEGACQRLMKREGARVVIGGLGMGFTLAAALRSLPANAEVLVAELVPAIVEWNKGELGALAGRPLDDKRVTVTVGDVAPMIHGANKMVDAILLDVDNGPSALTRATNQRLYSTEGLKATLRSLRPNGILAVWSVAPDDAFTRRLNTAGFATEVTIARAHAGKGTRHVLWFARRSGRE
jgi:spermidine synthase